MTTSLTLMRCHGCWHPKPAARVQKRTVGPLGIFPPKVMQHPRRHPSLCTLLAALASGGGIVKAFPLGTPTYPHAGTALWDCFSRAWEPPKDGSPGPKTPSSLAEPPSREGGSTRAHVLGAGGTRGQGQWVHALRSPERWGSTGSRPAPMLPPPHPSASPHGDPPCPLQVPGPPGPERTPQGRQSPTCVRTDGLRDSWGRAGELQG